ncbi:hypothetical protein [Luteimonas sp. R10]|uniref:hypothetical protein n=1 Tax=Luteimonas sp. R10 TaxID=3108176 RepID=UPI003089EF09|nr:hypothetical protein U3649_14430 [Luteimonas sp. R10]
MSIANVYISLAKDWALIGSDTAGRPWDDSNVPTGDPDRAMCKLLPIPLSNAILAVRGERTFYNFLWWQMISSDRGSFDALIEELPRAHERTKEEARKHQVTPYVDGTWAMVGWSERAQGMRFMSMKSKDGKIDTMDSFEQGWRMMQAPPQGMVTDSPEKMFECGKIQVRDTRHLHPEHAIGGQMLVAVLERNRLTIENMGDLG